MPSRFKGLASTAVCILFVFGVLAIIGGFIRIFLPMNRTIITIGAYFGFGIGSLFLSVIAARIRQMMG